MTSGRAANRPRQVGELVSRVLDPVLEKRAGISASLLQSWDEVVGAKLAGATRPHKVQWPRRASEDDPFEPATLTIAADPSVAFILQHETSEVIARVNAFLGFAAIARIRIVQKPVGQRETAKGPAAPLGEQARRRLAQATILLGFRGPLVHLEPPSTTVEGGTLAVSLAGTAVMYFGNTIAGLLMTIAGPLATMILREKAIRDLRAAAHREIPRALQASFADLDQALAKVVGEQVAALEEHLVLANAQLGEQLVAVLDRAAKVLEAPAEVAEGAGETEGEGEPPRFRARARLQALVRELEAVQRELSVAQRDSDAG